MTTQQPRGTSITRSVQAKLLAMLVVLSLPLLIVSLLQLDSSERSTNNQTSALAKAKAAVAAASLENWLQDNDYNPAQPAPLTSAQRSDLYTRVKQRAEISSDETLVLRDASDNIIADNEPSVPPPTPPVDASKMQAEGSSNTLRTLTQASVASMSSESTVSPPRWSDGVHRVTTIREVEGYGWKVAIGLPLAENTPAGRSVLWLTMTWALALFSSILLAVWAVGRFTNPLRRLAATASTLGEGRLQTRAVIETRDEVGTLAASFNSMAESLEARFEEVHTQGIFIKEVLDNLPLGVAVLDGRLTIKTANPTFKKFVGRADDDLLESRGLYEAAAGLASLRDVIEDVRRTRQTFVSYGLPLDLVARREGEEREESFWDVILFPITNRNAERGDLILILNEVSKRVRAEKLATVAFAAERARAAELSSVINQMDEGVVIVDRRGRYRINPAAATILAREPGEFRDGVEALIDDIALRDLLLRPLAPAETPLRRTLDASERVSGEQYKIVRPNKRALGGEEERVLAVSSSPLIGDNERSEGAIAVFRDITEEVTSRNKILEAYERLREHDRLKTAFVANVSHELRTPLNVILGMCQLLERDRAHPLVETQLESVERMERNARSLLALVNNLLEYSRLEAGRSALRLEMVDVAEVVRDATVVFVPQAEAKGIKLEIEIEPELRRVYTDERKLSQVISNLVSNAVKFTNEGEVRISAMRLDERRWLMEVADTGIGIAPDQQSYIFDEFRQVDERLARRYGGTGLGLALTRKIVALLGGEITLESEPQRGSRFRIIWEQTPQPRTGTGSLLTPAGVAQNETTDGERSTRV